MSSHPTRLHARAHLLGGRITLSCWTPASPCG